MLDLHTAKPHHKKQNTFTPKNFTKTALSSAIAFFAMTGGVHHADAAILTLSAPSQIDEGSGPAVITVSLTLEPGDTSPTETCTVTGNLAFAASDSSATEGGEGGGDFSYNPSFTVQYEPDLFEIVPSNPGENRSLQRPIPDTVSININDDTEDESDETMVFSAQNIVSNCSFYGGVIPDQDITITITDNDDETPPPPPPPSGDLADTVGLNSRQISVATILDQSCATITAIPATDRTAAQNELLAACGELQTSSTLTSDLDNLLNEELFSMGTLAKQSARLQSQNLAKQIRRARSGLRGNDISGLNLNIDGQQLSGQQLNKMMGSGAGDTSLDSQWGSFIGGSIQVGDRDQNDTRQGYDFKVNALHAGIDYRANEHFVVGGAIGYTDSGADADDDIGETTLSGISIGLFSSYYYNDNYYIDTIISYGKSDYETKRDASFASTSQVANGDTEGDELSLSLNTGYYFRYTNTFLHLFGTLNYIDVNVDGFQEKNSNGSSSGTLLNVDEQELKSLTSNIGLELGWTINTSSAVITPQFSVDWEHQYEDDAQELSGSFVGDLTNSRFNIEDESQDQDYFNAGFSISAIFKGGFSAYGSYEIDLSREDFDLYDISVGARWEF